MPQTVTFTIGDPLQEIWDRFDVNTSLTIGNAGTHFPCDTTSGNITLTLPPAANHIERVINIKKLVAANTLTIDGNGAELIEGNATLTVTQKGVSITITSNGTGWEII